jgi:hypothetical protein
MNAIPQRHGAATIGRLASLYAVRDPGVDQFLAANPDLVPDLIDVAKAITRYFGLDAQLALETLDDPEDAASEQELFAVISTTLSPLQALDRLDAFDEGWWLARSRAIGPRLTVTLD